MNPDDTNTNGPATEGEGTDNTATSNPEGKETEEQAA